MEKSIGASQDYLTAIMEQFQLSNVDCKTYSPLVLAYIGDCIFDLIIRTIVISKGNRQTHKLHKEASSLVKAASQADFIDILEDALTEEEKAVYKRGRNASPHTVPKNADLLDYKKATGFEAVLGYLYLQQNMQRAIELVKLGFDRLQIEV